MNWRDRIQIRTLAYTGIAILLVCAVVFAGIAGYYTLAAYYPPHISALLTAAGFLILAITLLIITNIITSRRHRPYRQKQGHPADNLETALASSIEPVIGDWIRRNPGSAAAVSVLLGAAAGSSESVRRVLQDAYCRYTENHGSDES